MQPNLCTQRGKRLIAKARNFISQLDEQQGCTEVEKSGCAGSIRTCLLALIGGMNHGHWDNVAEAFVMLQQIEFHYRPGDEKSLGFFLDKEIDAA